MTEYFTYRGYAWLIVSIILIVFASIRWIYRKPKQDDPEYIMRDPFIADDNRIALLKKDSPKSGGKNPVIKLPGMYSRKEIEFIEEWYSEQGIYQLRQSNGKEFKYLYQHPVFEEYTYVEVGNIPVSTPVRDKRTLQLIPRIEFKTVKLLVLDAWIK